MNEKLRLIKLYHTITNQIGMDEDERKDVLFSWFGVMSSKDLTIAELRMLCKRLQEMRGEVVKTEDIWRKRVIKVVFDYYESLDKFCNMNIAKATICRAAKTRDINKISVTKLQSLYNAFKYHAQAFKSVTQEAERIINSRYETIEKNK